ncbi:MAG: TetR/AcrR family transcriptional regulator [Candidatus Heimdallarchaeum aukensis]|uniref:TetR/AcrR family transcriptional regulator n=1 Tax=Candidatus Heimdallarchaeum aukensis TaxID=2876573 RepID=A0A9Y1BLY6_9ARCH|nr:MAG: TetR/AcrR family transcriptional regulator [Candidatus Heimdallarchaeum aukensis]
MNDSFRMRKDQRKELIKQVAIQKMVEEGIENVSMKSIAEEAEISDTLLYRYYPSKYVILYDFFLCEFDKINDRIEEIFETIKIMITDLSQSIPILVKILKKLLREFKYGLLLLINEEEKIFTYLEEGRKIWEEKGENVPTLSLEYFLNKQTVEVIAEYFLRCKKDGFFKETIDPKVASMMLITIIWQTIIKRPYKFLEPEMKEEEYDRLLDAQIDIIIKALTPKSKSEK